MMPGTILVSTLPGLLVATFLLGTNMWREDCQGESELCGASSYKNTNPNLHLRVCAYLGAVNNVPGNCCWDQHASLCHVPSGETGAVGKCRFPAGLATLGCSAKAWQRWPSYPKPEPLGCDHMTLKDRRPVSALLTS